ncbi:uncharacterized protein [Euphorbia lathyris]|uniref:uncharacterized protein isoform X8 n=1 Tax=Euphorbia lathyris TaxID=212925 RepID=UPI0033143F67
MSRNLKLSFVKLWFCTSRISQSPIESVRPRSFLSFGFFTVLLQEPRSRVQVLDMLMIDLLLCLFAGILSIGIGDTCFLRQVQIALWISPPIRFMSAGGHWALAFRKQVWGYRASMRSPTGARPYSMQGLF